MQEFQGTYSFDDLRKDMKELLAAYEKPRSMYDHVKDLQQRVGRDSEQWLQARGLGKRETSAEFAERFYADAADMDAEKATALLSQYLDKGGEELDKAITSLSEVVVGTVKTGLAGLSLSPEAVEEGIGLFDKVRKLLVNPHGDKEDSLSAVEAKYRSEANQSGERLVALALMAINSQAYKTSHRLRSLNLPAGQSDVVDGFKTAHATGLPNLSEIATAVPQIKELMESAKRRSARMVEKAGNFGVEVAISLHTAGIVQNSVDAAQAGFLKHHSNRLMSLPVKSVERGYGRLSDLLEASDLAMRAADRVRSMFATHPDFSMSLVPASMFLSTVQGACRGCGFNPPSGPVEREVDVSNALEELEIAKMIVRSEGLKHHDLRDGCLTVSSAIDETKGYLTTMAKHGVTRLRISCGPSDTDFFSRLRDETRWQYEPVKAAADERDARDVARKKHSFSEHAREQIGERLANQMAGRIRTTLLATEDEQPQANSQPTAQPNTPRPR